MSPRLWFVPALVIGDAGLVLGILRLLSTLDPFRFAWAADPVVAIISGTAAGVLGGVLAAVLPRRFLKVSYFVLVANLAVVVLPLPAGAQLGLLLVVQGAALSGFRPLRLLAPSLGLFSGTLAVYWGTAAPGLVLGDTGVFQVSAVTLGVPHPTGYPLLMLVGHVTAGLTANPAFGITLLSLLGGSLAAVVAMLWMASDDLPVVLATAVAAAAAFFPGMWAQAVLGEAYPLHVAFALVAVAAGWAALRGHPGRWLPVAALAIGLGLAHHRIIVLVLPAVGLAFLFALLTRQYRLRWWDLLAIPAALVPLLTYLYLPWRTPGMDLDGFRAIVFADRFAGFLEPFGPLQDPGRWTLLVDLAPGVIPLAWVLVALAGLVVLGFRRPLGLIVILALIVPHAYFLLAYTVPDAPVYLLMLGPVAAFLAGQWWFVPAGLIQGSLPPAPANDRRALEVRFLRIRARLHGTAAGMAVPVVALAGWALADLWPVLDGSGDLAAQRQAETFAAGVGLLPGGAVVIADVGRYAPLLWATRVLTEREDIAVLLPEDEALQRTIIAREAGRGRTTYLARYLPALERDFGFLALGDLAALTPAASQPPPATVLARFEPGVEVVTATVPGPVAADGILPVGIEWHAAAKIDPQYWPRLVAVDPGGHRVVLAEGRDPVNGLYPTRFWRPGERIIDAYLVPLDLRLPPGTFQLELEMAVPFQDRVAALADGSGSRVVLGSFAVTPAEAPPWLGRTSGTLYGDDLLLLGLASDPGTPDVLQATWWAGPAGIGEPRRVTMTAARAGVVMATQTAWVAAAPGGTFGTTWRIPGWAPGEQLDFQVVVTGPDGFPLPAGCGWPRQACDGTFAFSSPAAAADGLANFGNRMELESAAVSREPGGPVTMDLAWSGLVPMSEEYTVTVQLLDPRGTLVGQQDRPPGDGRRPTSTWRPGERIADRFEVMPAAGAQGPFRVIVAVYLPSTFTRLPVLGTDGQPTADFVVLGTVP